MKARRMVFIDESGATTSMTRTRGRAPRGERLPGAVPQGHWQVTTLIGALRADGLATATSIEAPTDSEVFRLFVRKALVPVLHAGDVVIMDNLWPHKASGVAEMIESAGAKVMYLPPYSPDFSPIEPCWSKVKERLRAAGARDQQTLGRAINEALAAVSKQDARSWFDQCGYPLH